MIAEPTTTTDAVAMALDELAASLSDVPGRTPQDAQIAGVLLSLTATYARTTVMSPFLLTTLHGYGADVSEAQDVARALAGLSLRLGAYLGRGGR